MTMTLVSRPASARRHRPRRSGGIATAPAGGVAAGLPRFAGRSSPASPQPRAAGGASSTAPLRTGGRPLDPAERGFFEPRFGRDLGHVRLHQGAEAADLADLAGARAFAFGEHVWLGSQGSTSDRELLAHELAHAVQGDEVLRLREATWLERRAWLAFFDHYLPRKFLNNYMDDTGNPITLTRPEMMDCNPLLDLRRSPAFRSQVAKLAAQGGGQRSLNVTGWGGARTNGTLGNFTVHYSGTLTVHQDGSWDFSGSMWFEDYWDFNTGGANRPIGAEVKVRVANAFLPGRPFAIDSVAVPASQSSSDGRVSWAAGPPVHVSDRAARTGADIVAGGAGGDVAGGVAGGDIGGEVGAQSSEDLNP